MIGALTIHRPRDFTFIDLGCEKGLTLAFATRGGVPPSHRRGARWRPRGDSLEERREIHAYRERIAGVHGDASTAGLPSAPTALYIFNPFGP